VSVVRLLTVLRTGGDYTPMHVQAMQRQAAKWCPPGTEFVCLSNVDVPGVKCIPLKTSWPNWWTKLELFRPDIEGDFLYTDLDNVLVGPIDPECWEVGKFTCNGVRGYNTAFMYIPESVRSIAWDMFNEDPEGHMRDGKEPVDSLVGDEIFLKKALGHLVQRWEDVWPGRVVLGCNPKFEPRFTPLWVPTTERVVVCASTRGRPWKHKIFRRYGMYQEKP
jgi:hypothetical protein